MSVRDGMGFTPYKSDTGRSERHVPKEEVKKEEVDEGDGVRPADRHRAKNSLLLFFALPAIAWFSWLYNVVTEKSGGRGWGASAVAFFVLCGYWSYRQFNPRDKKNDSKPRD